MPTQKPLLICVVGPTAIGKTALSIEIASYFSTEILSADSRQFYKEMHIGTAVPEIEELSSVPHHFIQNRSIFESYSVGDYQKEVDRLLQDLFQKHSIVVMVGGSGLYIDAVVSGLDDFPKIDPNIRDALIKQYEHSGLSYLQQELKVADPDYYERVDKSNHHRLIRALEICWGTGKPYSSYLGQATQQQFFDTLFIGLTAEREIVYDRINTRVDQMVESGLVEEARALYEYRELNALQTVGYRELFDYFDGKLELEEAISEIKKNTRRFAKRQHTWFKKNDQIHWFSHDAPFDEIIGFIKTKSAQ